MNISGLAVRKLNELKKDKNLLRISVKGGGCSGMIYHMEWIGSPDEKDVQIPLQGADNDFKVVTDPRSMLFLKDVELDYSDDLNNSGFKWNNPSAKRSCGCGQSFS